MAGTGVIGRWAIAVATVALLAACSTDPGTTARPGSVTYTRSGGLAGERTELTVTADGAATLESRVGSRHVAWTRQLPDAETAQLGAALKAADLDSLQSGYTPKRPCNDCFVDTVAYGGRSVTVEGDAAPAELADVLGLLRPLADAE
jgi:hypothetical protein